MKYRYYIVRLGADNVVDGTNDKAVAERFRLSIEHFVIDAKAGKWLTGDIDGKEDLDVLPL